MRESFLALIFIVSLAVVSCTNKGTSTDSNLVKIDLDEVITVDMIVFANDGMMKNYNAVIQRFHESQDDIRVELENVFGEDWGDYEQTLRRNILSGDVPDIVDVSVVYRDALIEDGILMDMSSLVENSSLDLDLYFENQFNEYRVGDKLYGIPSGSLLMAVYINEDMFREAGVPLPSKKWSDAWTWDELVTSALKIKEFYAHDESIFGMTMAYSIGWHIPFIMSNKGTFLVEAKAGQNPVDEASSSVFHEVHDILFDKKAGPDMLELLKYQPYQFFMEGHAGIFIDGNWWMDSIRDNAEFEWSVVPMPVWQQAATGMYVDAWGIASESDAPEAAFEVLKFFLREEQQKSGIMKGIPVHKEAAMNIYADRFPDLSGEDIRVWFDGIGYGATPAYFYGWSLFEVEMTENLRKYAFNEISTEEFIERTQQSYLKNSR